MGRSLTDDEMCKRLARDFYIRDVLVVAPELIGKVLCVRNGKVWKDLIITETEAYRGAEDLACHASKGRTDRTDVMYQTGGRIYVYLIYGMYWMLNFVTGEENNPQAVLIRGVSNLKGPGKLTKELNIDRSFYGEDLVTSKRIWVQDSGILCKVDTGPRIGVDYAGEYWKNMPWRYFIKL